MITFYAVHAYGSYAWFTGQREAVAYFKQQRPVVPALQLTRVTPDAVIDLTLDLVPPGNQ